MPAAWLAGLAIAAQVSYPLLQGEALRRVTILAVALFAAASVTHAAAVFGPKATLRLVAVTGGICLGAEVLGVRTGIPFGSYRYAASLGPAIAGVPLLVPAAWLMMAYPALLLGRRLAAARTGSARTCSARTGSARTGSARRGLVIGAGAVALTGWDLFLDPQMVAAGHWIWTFPQPSVPGLGAIPLTNVAGWAVVAAVLIGVLDRILPGADQPVVPRHEGIPAALLTWTWLGSGLGNLAFFDRPVVAFYGLTVMGVVLVPYLWALARDARAPRRRT